METPLSQQDPETVFSQEEQIVAFVQAAYPTIDLSPGTALRDLVVKLYAHLETRIQEQIDLALISSSLLEISKNPDVVDEEQVDRVLSNFNVSRASGSSASGVLRLFLPSSSSTVIPANTVFTLAGEDFSPTQSFVLVNESSYTGDPSQRLLVSSGSLYTTTIDVAATSPGLSGNVRASTVVSKINPTNSRIVSAKADSDFVGGADADDNAALLVKAKDGVVGKAFSGRDHIKAKLKAQFASVKDVGVVGFLDPEMRRDLIDGIHIGNRVDIFVKSASYPSRVAERVAIQMLSYDEQFTKTAIFELVLPPSKAAGLYTVESIRSNLSQTGSFEIVYDSRTLMGNSRHLIGDSYVPPFTAYQNAVIKFKVGFDYLAEMATDQAKALWGPLTTGDSSEQPPSVLTALGPTIPDFFYAYIEYLQMPTLPEIQAYVDLAEERSLSSDMLVHAAVPVMCSLQMRLLKPAGAEDPDISSLKAALVSKFNSFAMGKSIPASALIHTAYQNIPSGYTVDLPVHMYGVVINPDLTKSVMFSSDALRPPNQPDKGVTANTCAFFLESSMVDISILECGT
jgi:hypothetical protein